ncbi:MAG TPA: DUF1801 domain-containing protein [Bacilli bacterium]
MATVEEIINSLPAERKEIISKLREIIRANLPLGFEESISYGFISYVVPKTIYPQGYHANPQEPLAFISIASQKNYLAFYHMGISLFPEVLSWFQSEYQKRVPTKLDMGVSCIRLKKYIPYDLLGELCTKIGVKEYIEKYEAVLKK